MFEPSSVIPFPTDEPDEVLVTGTVDGKVHNVLVHDADLRASYKACQDRHDKAVKVAQEKIKAAGAKLAAETGALATVSAFPLAIMEYERLTTPSRSAEEA